MFLRNRFGALGVGLLAGVLAAVGCSMGEGRKFSGEAKASDSSGAPVERTAKTTKPKLASTILLVDEILWSLGPDVRSRTVAVSAISDDPRYSESVGLWPKELARVGPNPAEIVALGPDTVFLASFSDQAYREALDEHFDLVVLGAFRGFEDFRANVRTIAEAAGVPAMAGELIAVFDARLAKLKALRPADEKSWPTCIAWESGYVAGALTTFDDAARAAGCINAVGAAGVNSHAAVDTEQLLAWDPDFFVVSCSGQTPASCDEGRASLKEMAGISELKSVKADRVIMVGPAQMSSVGPGMLDLAETIGTAIRAAK